MIEHLVFRATQHYPQGIMSYLHDHQWIRAKNYNAVTNNYSTTYMFATPTHFGLENTLHIIQQMLFQAQFNEQDLNKERQIILEEWRNNQGVVNRINMQRTQSVRTNSRYARHQPIGTIENIQHLQDKPYLTEKEIAQRTQPLLDEITIDDVKQQVEQWFSSEDQIVQYQAPNKTKITDFTLDEFQKLQANVNQQILFTPQPAKIAESVELPSIPIIQGKIIKEQYDKKAKIYEWILGNGDKVVWLKTPLAKDKTYWQSISQAGFQRKDLNRWRAQIIHQIIKQNIYNKQHNGIT